MGELFGGAAARDISPSSSQFLYGYPFVERYSTGIHDPLLSSALYLSDGETQVLFSANDIIFVGKGSTARARKRIGEATGIPEENILLSGTHTHSGPKTVDYLINEADECVPPTDPAYVGMMEDRIVEAGISAWEGRRPAVAGFALADGTGVGTNRRDPAGPADPEVPVLMVKDLAGRSIALMLVYSMHPTVLHEDSTLVSADFPGATRKYLQERVVGGECPVLYHTGPEGNQSPRHVTRGNTFEEAERLGVMLGKAVEGVLGSIEYSRDIGGISACRTSIDLPKKRLPLVDDARKARTAAREKLDRLRREGAPRQEVRTAECDWFGAEESVSLAEAAADGRIEKEYASVLPAEIQAIKLGSRTFVGWQGEVFVEYALQVKRAISDTYLINLANGELQGYIVTEEAAADGGYEASNGLFPPEAGDVLVDETLKLLGAGSDIR